MDFRSEGFAVAIQSTPVKRSGLPRSKQKTDISPQVAGFLELSYSVVTRLARSSLCMLFIEIFTIKSFKIAGKPT